MSILNVMRSQFPEYADMSDTALLREIQSVSGASIDELAPVLGLRTNAPGISSDMARGTGQLVGGIGTSLRDAGLEGIGGALQGWGQDKQLYNPSQIQSFDDVLSKPVVTAREAVGEMLPQVGASIAGRAAGAWAGARAGAAALPLHLRPLGAIGGGVAGALAPLFGQSYGGIRQQQEHDGIDDRGRALAAAIPATALDYLGIERVAGRAFQHGLGSMAREAGERAIPHIGRQALIGGAVEGPLTEIPQTVLERWGSHQELTGDDAMDDYAVAGAKGFLGGATIRGGLSIAAGQRRPLDTSTETDLLNPPAADNQPGVLALPAPTVYADSQGTATYGMQDEQRAQARWDAEGADLMSRYAPQRDNAPAPALEYSPTMFVDPTGYAQPGVMPSDADVAGRIFAPQREVAPDLVGPEAPVQAAQRPVAAPEASTPLAVARQAFVARGGTPAAWARFISTNKLIDADPTTLAEAVEAKANNPKTLNHEPWAAAHQAVLPRPAMPMVEQVTEQAAAPVQPPATFERPVITRRVAPRVTQPQETVDVPQAAQAQQGQPQAPAAPIVDGALAPSAQPVPAAQPVAEVVPNAPQRQEVVGQATPTPAAQAAPAPRRGGRQPAFVTPAPGAWATHVAQNGAGNADAARTALQQTITNERDRAVIWDALGWDADGHATRNPVVGEALAAKHGLSREGVRKLLNRYNLSQETLDDVRMTGSLVDRSRVVDDADPAGMTDVDGQVDLDGADVDPDAGTTVLSSDERVSRQDEDATGAAQEGLNVRQDMGSQVKVEADNDSVADRQYRKRLQELEDNGNLVTAARTQWGAYNAERSDAGTVPWESLGPGQQMWFTESNGEEDGSRMAYEMLTDERLEGSLSRAPGEGGTTVDAITSAVESLFPTATRAREKVVAVQSLDELRARPELQGVDIPDDAQGMVYNNRAYLVADQIQPGQEAAVLMHEVGGHMGMRGAVGPQAYAAMVNQVKRWAAQGGDSPEARIARAAQERVDATDAAERGDAVRDNELLAHFIEEAMIAGVTPTNAKGPLRQWFDRLMEGLRNALRTLGITRVDRLTPQNIVDLAYGAADMQLKGADASTVTDGPLHSRTTKVTDDIMKSLPPAGQEAVRRAVDSVRDVARRGLYFGIFTNDLVDAANKHLKSARTWYDAIKAKEVEKTRRQAAIDAIATRIDKLSRKAGNDEFTRTMELARDMRMEGLWGYQPSWRPAVPIDGKMAERWNALSQNEQQVLDAMFKHGADSLKETRAVLTQIVDAEFDARSAKAGPDEAAQIAKDRAAAHRRLGRTLPAAQGPYTPLRRVGNYVFTARSQRLIDAKNANDTKLVAELERSSDHYMVRFVDTLAEAQALQREPEAKKFAFTRAAAKRELFDNQGDLPFESFEKIRASLEALPGDAKNEYGKKLNDIITELYITSLGDTSARKSELKAKKAGGMDADGIFRAFVSKGGADAHYIASLKNNRAIHDAMRAMGREAGASRDPAATDAFNEMARRYRNNMEHDASPMAGRLLGFTSVWQLLTKPAYYMYNATQVALMSQPYVAQKYGYSKSFGAFVQAYKDYANVKGAFDPRENGVNLNALPGDVRQAMHDLTNSGKIDITLAQDLGSYAHGSRSPAGRAVQTAHRALRNVAQKSEMMNRIVTATAAYRMARSDGRSHESAVDYAGEVIDSTHGDYTNFNAPRLFNANTAMRVITQFKKFALIQSTFLAKGMHEAMKGKTPQERWAARKMLAFTLGHHMVLAGGLGLIPGPVKSIIEGMLGDDDEPVDLEAWFRRNMGNDPMVELLLNGVPTLAGINMSGNVGLQGAFNLTGFREIDLSSRQGYTDTVMSLLGPLIGGLGAQMADGYGKIKDGDYYGGLAQMMPSGVRGAMKAIGEHTDGVRNKSGDALVDASDIELFDTMLKALSLRTVTDANRQLVRSAQYEMDQYYNTRSRRLRRDYSEAYREGDSAAMRQAREDWMALQDSRRRNGYKVQPLSNLVRAPQDQARRERATVGGVQTRSNNEGFVRSLTGQ